MDKSLRTILWVLVGLVVLSSFSTGWFFVAKEKLYKDYIQLDNLFKTNIENLNAQIFSSNEERRELREKIEAIQSQFEILEIKNKELNREYESTLSDREGLKLELVRVKKGKSFLEKKLKEMEKDTFVASLLKDKVSLEVQVKRLKDSLVPKEMEIKELEAIKANLEREFTKLEEEKLALEERLKDSMQVSEILSRDLFAERERDKDEKLAFERFKIESDVLKNRISALEGVSVKCEELLSKNETLKARIASLETDLNYKEERIAKLSEVEPLKEKYSSALSEKERLIGEIAKLRGDLENRNKEFENLKTAYESEIKKIKGARAEAYHAPSEVDLPPIVLKREVKVKPSWEGSGESSRIRGRILTVNREHNFVVIDLGKKDGVSIGTTLSVYRDSIKIGSIEVIQMRDRIAAADIKDVDRDFKIEVDDIVLSQ